jgi:hypothetical protein
MGQLLTLAIVVGAVVMLRLSASYGMPFSANAEEKASKGKQK